MKARTQDSPDDRCLGIAKALHGLITYGQAIDAGKSQSGISRKVVNGEWTLVLPKVYAFDSFPRTWRQRALAAQLWGGDTCLISGAAAAYLLKMLEKPPDVIDLAVQGSTRSRADWVRTHNRVVIAPADRLVMGPFRVTTPARTLVDLSSTLSNIELEKTLDLGLRHELFSIARMKWTLTRLGTRGRKGSRVLERLVEARSNNKGRTETELEDVVARIIRRARLKPPMPQYYIRGVGRVDFYWPEDNLVVECDGFEHHQDRLAFEKDRQRWNKLTKRRYRLIIVTWDMGTKTPKETEEMIRDELRDGGLLGSTRIAGRYEER